jgi:hypothetical protein
MEGSIEALPGTRGKNTEKTVAFSGKRAKIGG